MSLGSLRVVAPAIVCVALGVSVAPAFGQAVAIVNAEIHTVSGGVIQGGTIVLQDGRITAVGTSVSVPAGATTIDGMGKVVTPGFIDSSSRIGLFEIGSGSPGSSDAATSEEDLGASFNPVWAVNPENTFIPVTRVGGVTSVVVSPGGGNLFTGQGALIALDGETVEDMIRRESVAVYTAMGESGSARAGGSRAANYRRLHDALWDARAKSLGDDEAEEDEDPDEDEGKDEDEDEDTKAKDPLAKGGRSKLDERDLESLEAVISGAVPLVVQANRASDLRLALKLKEDFGIDMVILGGDEGWRVADELAAARVPVVVIVTSNLPTFDGLSASLANAGRLQAAGVEVLFTGGRAITHQAGLAVANGMDHAAALRAVTLGAATVWGVSDQTGSLEEGKIADVVVWSGDPFELSTSVEHVFIGGRQIPSDSRQKRLFERYRDLGRYRTIRR